MCDEMVRRVKEGWAYGRKDVPNCDICPARCEILGVGYGALRDALKRGYKREKQMALELALACEKAGD